MIQKIKQHFSDVKNSIIYLLFAVVFFINLFENGLQQAIEEGAALGFIVSGMFVVAYVAVSIRDRDFSMEASDVISVIYFSGFCIYWFAEFGFNRKAFFLSLPILIGLVLVAGYLVIHTDTYRKLGSLERVLYQKLFSIFRKKL